MAKIIKRKRRIKVESLITIVFAVACISFLFSITVLRSQNVLLSRASNEIERSNDKLANDVANLEVEVKQLDNRDRILEIAKEHGLSVNQDSIVSVVSDGE
ncbi:MAG: cell division protein FtsL [Erysipelotrichia bacterium]|nr:cell division protein FtsL [Erysipelotrichia bacterium]NCC54774.1 cell division protein FtsL [Erysipelotrichia bacterium]